MILYNVTVKIDVDTHAEWLGWMKTVHIPDVLSKGLFTECRFMRLLGEDETDGFTYAFQYVAATMNDYRAYQEQHAPALQADVKKHFEGKFVSFRTLLHIEEVFKPN